MRICFYNVTATYLKGGLETYCWEAGRAMARRGHEVTIVAGNRGEARHDEVRLIQFPFRAEKEWPDLGVRFRRLAERLSFAKHAMGHMTDSNYEAIIVNKPFDFPVLWRLRSSGVLARTLFRSGGTDFFPGDRFFAGAIDYWVSSSRYNAKQVAEHYGRSITTIHNGVDTQTFDRLPVTGAMPSDIGTHERQLVLTSVGRLVGWKGIDVVIRAMKDLPANVCYLVIGDGPEKPKLIELVRSCGLQSRVRFMGAVNHEALPGLLSNCDVLVQPSKGEEAFGISVVEAMACGLAVLASNNGGLPEIVVEGEIGRLLPPGDVDAWRAAIAETATDLNRLRRWSKAARARAVAEFTWAANAAKLESVLMGKGI